LSHAGARAVANSDGELSIDSSLVLLCLVELGNGGIVDALQAAGYQTANMAERLAAIIQAPPIDDSLLANLKNRRGVVPDPSLRALLEQTRREGRSREAPVATTRDFLRSILATDGKARDALAAIGVNLDLLRELLDEQHFPDQEELATEDEVEEPLAQPGWTDPLSGLDPLTRQELLQGTPSPPSGAPLPVTDPSTLRPTAGTETNSPISSSAPQAPTRAGRPMRRMTLYNSENPSPEMIDAVTDLLESGRMVVFPSDCGLHALVRLDLEEPAAQLLRYRRALNLPASEVLLHNMRVAGDFPSEGSLQTHRAILGDLGDYRVAVRLPWQRRHGAIESLDETPGSGWHLGWRIPAHTALLAVLANLNRPVLALRADESDPALDRLQNHDSQPVAMAVTPARPVMPISPAVIDLRSERPRIDHPGSPAVDAEEIRRFLQWNPA
jgi:tRNA A37 threonylcarbamoyladenosine synthetase subunit TsaC/SUA5/YrdC